MSHHPLLARPSQPRHRGEPRRHRVAKASVAAAAVCALAVTNTSASLADSSRGRGQDQPVAGWSQWSGLGPGAVTGHGAGGGSGRGHGAKAGVFAVDHDTAGQHEDDQDGQDGHGDQHDSDSGAPVVTSGPSLGTSVDLSRNALATGASGATPAPLTPYELPFPCGQTWTGSTHPGHTPSPRAIDWNAPGDLGMPVVAAAAGTVTTARTGQHLASYGQYVVIDHGNGESSLYAHLDSVTVTVGQVVTAGTQLGTLGSTGNSTGPHLHFEERLNGVDQDVWLHGAAYPIGTPAASLNCGTAPVPVTTTTPVVTTAVPVAGNLFGSRAQAMLYHKRAYSYFAVSRGSKPAKKVLMGNAGDQPVLGDWDGNGTVNPGVRRPSSRTFYLRVRGADQKIRFGQGDDLPIAGNWDGTGGWEVGVRKAHAGVFKLRNADRTTTKVVLGDADDIPVTGDWNGDGITDLGVYDSASSVFTLRWVGAGGAVSTSQVAFGVPGDYPVAGDWNGDGLTDLGVWSPATRQFSLSGIDATVSARTAAAPQ